MPCFYAFKFYKRKRWERLFGPSSAEYKETYKFRPYSKNYVRHLEGYYAQYHPEEDFVETFAVWLNPQSMWEEKYKGWKALHKLKYVDRLMKEIKGKVPPVKSSEKYWRLSTLRLTLNSYYKRKRSYLAEEFPDFHDAFLKKLFQSPTEDNKNFIKAPLMIQKIKRNIINSTAQFSGGKKYIGKGTS